MKDNILLDGKKWIVTNQVLNTWFSKSGEIIGSFWGKLREVQKDSKEYEGKGYTFYVFKVDGTYIVRVVKNYLGEYGDFLFTN